MIEEKYFQQLTRYNSIVFSYWSHRMWKWPTAQFPHFGDRCPVEIPGPRPDSGSHVLIISRKEQCSTIFKVVGVGVSAVMFLLLLRALARSPTFRHLGINKPDPFPASANLCWNWNCLCQFSVSRPRSEPITVNLFSYFGLAYQFQFFKGPRLVDWLQNSCVSPWQKYVSHWHVPQRSTQSQTF